MVDCEQMMKVKLTEYPDCDEAPLELQNAYKNKVQIFYDFARRLKRDVIDNMQAPQLSLLYKEHHKQIERNHIAQLLDLPIGQICD